MNSNELLFLKFVHHIILFVNDQRLDEIEILNKHDLIKWFDVDVDDCYTLELTSKRLKKRFKNLLNDVMNHENLIDDETFRY